LTFSNYFMNPVEILSGRKRKRFELLHECFSRTGLPDKLTIAVQYDYKQ